MLLFLSKQLLIPSTLKLPSSGLVQMFCIDMNMHILTKRKKFKTFLK